MFNRLNAALMGLVILAVGAVTARASLGPTLIFKDSFGDQTNAWVIGTSSNQIDINFVVDHANGNGFGIRSLKGNGLLNVSSVYMNTSATPAAGNPNPAPGYILVNLSKKYQAYVGGYSGFVSPVSGTPIPVASASPGITPGAPYIIISAGTTPQSMWQSIGLAAGLTPSPGQAFVGVSPSPSPTVTGTGIVESPLAGGSGGLVFDIIGDPNQSVATTGGAQILIRILGGIIPYPAPSPSEALPMAAVAPADGTVIGMRFVYQ